ncbi:hypothetical protein ACFL09_00105, partial [Planctomycetota bacterium]
LKGSRTRFTERKEPRQAQQLYELSLPIGWAEVKKMNRCRLCDGLVTATKQGLCCPWCGSVVARAQKGLGEWVEVGGDEDGC